MFEDEYNIHVTENELTITDLKEGKADFEKL